MEYKSNKQMILEKKQLSLIIKWSAIKKPKKGKTKKVFVSDNQEASNINMRQSLFAVVQNQFCLVQHHEFSQVCLWLNSCRKSDNEQRPKGKRRNN